MALARGMKEKNDIDLKAAVNDGRLLIVTPFENNVKRVTLETAEKRNRFMIELADDVVIGYADKDGMVERLMAKVRGEG
ncbi:MAG: hypothetical protein V1899_07930 [Planctomycetota bacterium]